jgi:hypothetical protein
MTAAILDRAAVQEAIHRQRAAYNAAFYELGLQWYWDIDTFQALQAIDCERGRIRHYVEAQHPHLLRAYDADFLIDAVESTKTRVQRSGISDNPRHAPHFDGSAGRAYEIGA